MSPSIQPINVAARVIKYNDGDPREEGGVFHQNMSTQDRLVSFMAHDPPICIHVSHFGQTI